jgi:hypothetical protein
VKNWFQAFAFNFNVYRYSKSYWAKTKPPAPEDPTLGGGL